MGFWNLPVHVLPISSNFGKIVSIRLLPFIDILKLLFVSVTLSNSNVILQIDYLSFWRSSLYLFLLSTYFSRFLLYPLFISTIHCCNFFCSLRQ